MKVKIKIEEHEARLLKHCIIEEMKNQMGKLEFDRTMGASHSIEDYHGEIINNLKRLLYKIGKKMDERGIAE